MALAYPPLKPCPCGSGRSYSHCCGAFHSGVAVPASPEALMRARYSAYALQDEAFVLGTWHPETRPASMDLRDGTRYLGLKVHGTSDHEVTFTASLRLPGGERAHLRERSTFAQVDGRWVYVDGVQP